MQTIINPSTLYGSITPPASKSMMQRACAGALLHTGKTVIKNPGHSDDDLAALNIIQDLGAVVKRQGDGSIEIVSDGTVHPASSIDCGESGLSARMFAPIAALADCQVTITGKGSLLHRPMNALQEILLSLGVNLPGFNGYLPITVHGPLVPKNIRISSSHSSQYLTGALFALTAAAQRPITIEVPELYSKPYVDLTLGVLRLFGKTVKHEDYTTFYIDPAAFAKPETVTIDIESDWSSAAYWMAGAAINGNISVNQLGFDTTQADKAIVEVLEMVGAKMTEEHGKVSVSSAEKLRSFQFDATHSPDLFPILAILAACAEGESKITGIRRLIHKESNRETSITDMLQQFGVNCKTEEDTLVINGQRALRAATINSHYDHRIAMAAAIGALNADGPVTITSAHAVSKSYPDFFNHLASLGAQVEQKV